MLLPGETMSDFTYPGQVTDETGRETLEAFIDRIKGKYIAEKVLVEKPRTKIAIYGDSFAQLVKIHNQIECQIVKVGLGFTFSKHTRC